MPKRYRKWGLALGGGGARGIAHVGVIRALERRGLVPDVITGTSIGALVGAAYACRPDADALKERFCRVLSPESAENRPLKIIARFNWDDGEESTIFHRWFRSLQKEIFLGLAVFRNGVLSTDDLRSSVSAFVPDVDFAEARIPFGALTVDILSGKTQLLTSGPIIDAVMASCAVPGFMPPVRIGNALLMDGGLADLIPVDAARACGAETVIAVDVGIRLCDETRIEDGIDTINRATEIMSHHLGDPGRQRSDLLIQPIEKPLEWTDFTGYAGLIRAGEEAAEDAIEDIARLA